MSPLEIALPDQAATEHLAERTAALLHPADVVLLAGALGAGKSTFARALLRCLADDPALEVPSPTFTLQQTYDTRLGPVHHFDLWRLADPSALAELGWGDSLGDLVLVEWPDRLGPHPPDGALSLCFTITGADSRTVTITGWPERRMEQLR